MKNFIILFSLLAIAAEVQAQRFYQPLGRFYDLDMQQTLCCDSSKSFSSVKPVLILETERDTSKSESFGKWCKKHFLEDDFIVYDREDYSLRINPIFNFVLTKCSDYSDKNYYLNCRGIEAFGRLGNRIHFQTEFYENQAVYMPFEDSIIAKSQRGLIPGIGHGKGYKEDGRDFAMAVGDVTIDITSHFRITLGNNKNFFGSGYRSVILSDLTFPYPYLRYDLNFGKFYYYAYWMKQRCGNFGYARNSDLHYKYGSYHVAGFKPNNLLEIAVIEGVMWNNKKDGVETYNPKADMLFPVIFFPLMSNGFDSENKVSLGYDLNFTPIKNVKLYHQLNYLGKQQNADGEISLLSYQYGFHVFDLLFGLVPDLNSHLQFEQTVSRLDDKTQDISFWSSYYPLSTPFFADNNQGKETVIFLDLEYKRFAIDAKYLNRNNSNYRDITFRYFFNKKTKWNLYVSACHHDCSAEVYRKAWDNDYITIGMSICPANFYYDF